MKRILIIGAGFLQSFVIKKAKKMGYETFTVDFNPESVGFQYADHYKVIDIVDKEACLKYAKKNNIDGVLTAATDYGVLTTSYIAQEMRLPGLNYDVAKLVKNKYQVRKRLFCPNNYCTEQVYEINQYTNLNELGQTLTFPVIVKPCDGSGSRGVQKIESFESFAKICFHAMKASITHTVMIEPFIFGKEYGAESIVLNGDIHVLGVMRKWMTASSYHAELGHAIPTDLPTHIEEQIKDSVKNVIKLLGINFGSVNMDIIVTPENKIHIIDVGARMGGNMIGPCIIPYGTGIDYMSVLIRSAMGDDVDLKSFNRGVVVTRLLTFHQGVVVNLPDFKALEDEYAVEIYHQLSIGQIVNEYRTNLDGCGYIISRDKDIENAIKKADVVLSIIRNIIFND